VLYLTKCDLLEIPVLYLSRHITRNKDTYYRLLQDVRNEGAWEAWVLFILEAVAETSDATLVLVEGIRTQMRDMKTRLRDELPKLYSQDLLNNLFRHPYTRIDFVLEELGVSRQTAAVPRCCRWGRLGVREADVRCSCVASRAIQHKAATRRKAEHKNAAFAPMAALSPTCEFAFLAASARSTKVAASAQISTLRSGGVSGHSIMAQRSCSLQRSSRGLKRTSVEACQIGSGIMLTNNSLVKILGSHVGEQSCRLPIRSGCPPLMGRLSPFLPAARDQSNVGTEGHF